MRSQSFGTGTGTIFRPLDRPRILRRFPSQLRSGLTLASQTYCFASARRSGTTNSSRRPITLDPNKDCVLEVVCIQKPSGMSRNHSTRLLRLEPIAEEFEVCFRGLISRLLTVR